MSDAVGDGVEMGWHADRALLSAYVRNEIDQAASARVEAHLLGCTACRAGLGCFADPGRLERGREALLDAINAPRRGPLEALLVRVGMVDTTARLVAATPSLSASWLAAVAIA